MKKLLAIIAFTLMALGLTACEEEDSGVTIKSDTNAQIGKTAKVVASKEAIKTVSVAHTLNYHGESIPITTTYGVARKSASNWSFTYPNNIDLQIKTGVLPNNVHMLLNQVYSDVSIISTKTSANGIRQDSMSQSYSSLPAGGVTIDENDDYEVPFQVEGINENETSLTLIDGYGWTTAHHIDDSDLKEHGATGAKLNVVWTLLINEDNKSVAKTIVDHIGLPSK